MAAASVKKRIDLDLAMKLKVIQQFIADKLGIIAIEDLIHEIYTMGPNFKKANNLLRHFKLNTPSSKWCKKANNYSKGGNFGNREDLVNWLLHQLI